MRINIPTARVFQPLLPPARYKGAWGGRGSGKSYHWAGQAIEALLEGRNVLCIREVQNSIADSVKRLIEARIDEFGLGAYFKITDKEVRCPPAGSVAIFRGMQNHTAASIKSLEGFDVAWWEEAQTASQFSLDLLIPTIRKPGSELWFSWNPTEESDPIDQFLRHSPPEGAVVVKANWADNPWFPAELLADMQRDRKRDPEKYRHIWEGDYQSLSEARIFRNWREGVIDPPDRVIWYCGVDFGFAQDPTAAVRCCIPRDGVLYIDREAWQVGVSNEALPELLHRVPEIHKWPCRADSARPETIDYLRRNGFPKMRGASKGKGSVEDGIGFLQGFDIVVHPRCVNMLRELGSYAYKIDKRTNDILPIPEDANDHLCIAEGQRVLTRRGLVPIERVSTADEVMTREGFRRVLAAKMTGRDRKVVRLETTIGALVCTPDHQVWTAKGFVRADALRYNDEIIGDARWQKEHSGTGRSIAGGRQQGSAATAYIFSAASRVGSSICTALSGSIITGQSQAGTTSTMWMATPATTASKIWSALRPISTPHAIRSAPSDWLGSLSTWPAFGRSQRHGTQAPRGSMSTGVSGQWPTLSSSPSLSGARIAPKGSRRERLAMRTCSAEISVEPPRAGLLGSMMRTALAWFAARRSGSTDTARHRPVAGRVVTVSAHGQSSRVYDLAVEGRPEFFAEGVLVHNCDALRYAVEGLHKKGKLLPDPHAAELRKPRDYGWNEPQEESWKVV